MTQITNQLSPLQISNGTSFLSSCLTKIQNHKAIVGVVALAALSGLYYALKNQSEAPVYRFNMAEGQVATHQFYVLHGLANPGFRCAKILSEALVQQNVPTEIFVGNPRHIIPGFGRERNTDLPGITQFAQMPRQEGQKRILVGHSCGAVDAINHLVEGTLPEGIDGVIAISPFGMTQDLVLPWTPAWLPDLITRCICSVVSLALWKYRAHQPGVTLGKVDYQTPEGQAGIPTLLLACQGDLVVDTQGTVLLRDQLKVDRDFNLINSERLFSSNDIGLNRLSIHDYGATTQFNKGQITQFLT